MFTGIIQTNAKVTSKKAKGQGLELTIVKTKDLKVKNGDSVSVNGVCSTVTETKNGITFWYMPETLKKSNLSELNPGDMVNIEQSLKTSDRLDGHIVLGHVDAIGKISSIKKQGDSKVFTVSVPDKKLMRLVAPKGSICLDGISLTVVDATKNSFSAHIIPYTLEHTNLHTKKNGHTINIEFDILAKYVQSSLSK